MNVHQSASLASHNSVAGMSPDLLRRAEAHLQKNYIDTGRFPGTQLTVFRRGEVVTSLGGYDLSEVGAVQLLD